MSVASDTAVSERRGQVQQMSVPASARGWMRAYVRRAVLTDCACALGAGLIAASLHVAHRGAFSTIDLGVTGTLPAVWWLCVSIAGGYDPRFIGLGSEEFRRVLNAAAGLAAALAMFAYVAGVDLRRGYVMAALPLVAVLDVTARYRLRKHLHSQRNRGACNHRVLAVGHAPAVADLVATLRRERYHGLSVVAACVPGSRDGGEVAEVPVAGELATVASAVGEFHVDTVAVLACPEMDGERLRDLAWQLEKSGTDLCVAPALLDVAGPRTTIRPVAGLPLLHVDHPELAGGKQIIKSAFDRSAALAALIVLLPVFLVIACAIVASDRGPVFFRQTRVGKDGRTFILYKFRSMVVGADQWKARLARMNEADGALFKIRRDPRVTPVGSLLRRWSLDELPQLLNVLRGDMSLVGPRPALPEEAARYGHHVRRRLAVKPGITGLWQVSGRSDLPWDESVRLDLRYVENWSFALDLQILWKTSFAVIRGSGAY